ncbi:MAG: ADP-ribosylglycohydrolase family protein [Anaerolineae bacterium]|nr:ADP-ribosylglycohydrolase family protein [Anaerolineae bacterium]
MLIFMPTDPRLQRAYTALIGLSVGDAYGNHHGYNHRKHSAVTWEYSDDTQMALSIYAQLRRYGEIRQDELAQQFALRREGKRGYGQGVTRLFKAIASGGDWRALSIGMFEGTGSYGNGAAMRIAPLGAYFADDTEMLIAQAEKSAVVTHAHPEGIAGGIAVTMAAAIVTNARQQPHALTRETFLSAILSRMPPSEIRRKLEKALALNPTTTPHEASKRLGNGRPSIAQMTVPFALWLAGSYLDDFQVAIEKTASVGGDIDTNCAIVGSIVASHTGLDQIPADWLHRLETLPVWAFSDEEDHESAD